MEKVRRCNGGRREEGVLGGEGAGGGGKKKGGRPATAGSPLEIWEACNNCVCDHHCKLFLCLSVGVLVRVCIARNTFIAVY